MAMKSFGTAQNTVYPIWEGDALLLKQTLTQLGVKHKVQVTTFYGEEFSSFNVENANEVAHRLALSGWHQE